MINLDELNKYIDEHYEPDERKGLIFKSAKKRKPARKKFSDTLFDGSSMKFCMMMPDAYHKELSFDYEETTWQEELLDLIDKSGLSDPEVYKKAGLSKQTFSKIRSNKDYHPDKDTAVLFCFALELSLSDAIEFIAKAGFTFSKSIKRDIIFTFCLEHFHYDVDELNNTLFDMKLKTILKTEK